MTLQRIVLFAILSLILACGTARRDATVAEAVDLTATAIQNGEQTFMNYCYRCHPGGADGLGPALNNKALPGFAIKFQVRHGVGVMPSFSKEVISKEKLDDLVAYLKALRKADVR